MNDKLLLSVFVAVEGAHAFSAFMPSYFTVKKFAGDEGDKEALRSGYPPAVMFNLVLGAVVSAMAEDVRPLLFSIVVCISMIVLYEQAIGESAE